MKITAVFALGAVTYGLLFRGLIGVEAVHVVQTAFFAVSFLSTVSPMEPIARLSELANGYTYRSSPPLEKPEALNSMNVASEFLANCNIMLSLQVAALAGAIIAFAINYFKTNSNGDP